MRTRRNGIGRAAMATLALWWVVVAAACSTVGTTYDKAPVAVKTGEETAELAEHIAFRFDGSTSEWLIWDKYNGNIALGSSADTGLEGLDFTVGLDPATGETRAVSLKIDKRDANVTDPTSAAWDGVVAYAEANGKTVTEVVAAIAEAAAGLANPVGLDLGGGPAAPPDGAGAAAAGRAAELAAEAETTETTETTDGDGPDGSE